MNIILSYIIGTLLRRCVILSVAYVSLTERKLFFRQLKELLHVDT